MAFDLRQVMAAFLTFSMFVMLGNMIKRDHIDPLIEWESLPVKYSNLKPTSKPKVLKLSEINNGPWLEHDEPVQTCWRNPILKSKQQSGGYVFVSLTHGPEYHASQVANAVLIARKLGATLALPDITKYKSGEKRSFSEVYNLDKFLASLSGVVPVEKALPVKLLYSRLPIVQVPEQVSEEFISSKIMPVYLSKRNLKIFTYFTSSAKVNGSVNQQSNAYQCLAMFESLKLQPWLQKLADSMVGTLRSLSMTMGGRFLVVDFRVEMLGQLACMDSCLSAQEIGMFLEKIGFHPNTTIYLTQTGWHNSLDALRSIFPNTFIKDAIMPADEKGKFMDMKSRELERYIDYYMCMQGDVFVPALPDRFYTSVVGERIRLGKTRILVPAKNTSESAADYVSPYVAKKSHFAYSCLC
ncbi:O-fucosyltransferase family protein [Striga hermonthica]|uniref:O-fucosyltransferase family protein n=1 Tax=Striga hermonthica TaxID=68872 RepID=A0A9N7MX53_STRHE|nr:O-fucosyltransferase family protein [Striga hermonthica]